MDVAVCEFTGGGADNPCFGSEFHQLSQELRNPLNSINGFAELLLMDEGLSPAHADYVRAILTGSEALTAAVVSILDRFEERVPSPVLSAGHKLSCDAPAPPRPIVKRARRWGSPRNLRLERSGTL